MKTLTWVSRRSSLLFMMLAIAAAPLVTRADSINGATKSTRLVSLSGAVAVGVENLEFLASTGGAGNDFVVPENMDFVLTDIIFSPQSIGTPEEYVVQILSHPSLTTALTATLNRSEPSSFQINLSSGMVFPSGSKVKISLVFGGSPLNVSAFGFLAKTRQSHGNGD